MSALTNFLYDRLNQLENRILSITIYADNPNSFAGKKKDFSLKDIPKLHKEINETNAALRGIAEWNKAKKTIKPQSTEQ